MACLSRAPKHWSDISFVKGREMEFAFAGAMVGIWLEGLRYGV
jgi:hypothetical protein